MHGIIIDMVRVPSRGIDERRDRRKGAWSDRICMGIRCQGVIKVGSKIITMLLSRHPSHGALLRLFGLVRLLAFS